jgi:hypothetical protein
MNEKDIIDEICRIERELITLLVQYQIDSLGYDPAFIEREIRHHEGVLKEEYDCLNSENAVFEKRSLPFCLDEYKNIRIAYTENDVLVIQYRHHFFKFNSTDLKESFQRIIKDSPYYDESEHKIEL